MTINITPEQASIVACAKVDLLAMERLADHILDSGGIIETRVQFLTLYKKYKYLFVGQGVCVDELIRKRDYDGMIKTLTVVMSWPGLR